MITEKMKNIVFYIKTDVDNKMRKYNLTTVQILLLEFLNNNRDKEIIQKDICEHLSLKHSTIINILKRLESKELITKKTNYKSVISITDKGKELLKKLGVKTGFIEDILLNGFTKEEIEVLSSQLDRMFKSVSNTK